MLFLTIIISCVPTPSRSQHAVRGFGELHIKYKLQVVAIVYVCVIVANTSTQPLHPTDSGSFSITQRQEF